MMHFGLQELTVNEINAKFSEYMSCQDNAESAANYIYDSLVEDLTMGLLFEFHHGLKTGLTDLLEGEPEHEEPLLIVNAPDCDVFGLSATKKTPDCNCCCPHCERTVSATRFAPHLEKCMGMGRNSSRIASRRIASNSKEPALYAGIMSDDDDDVDWVGGDRKKKKIRSNGVKKLAKLNNGSSKVTATNGGSSDGASSSQDTGGATFDTMTPNERKSLLLHVCGVVSEHTKKICTRSIRCPQHTEEQRKALRNSVLESVASLDHNTGDGSTPLTPNDVGSPPDSSPSSSCSSSSRKRDKHRSKSSKGRREKTNYSPGRE